MMTMNTASFFANVDLVFLLALPTLIGAAAPGLVLALPKPQADA